MKLYLILLSILVIISCSKDKSTNPDDSQITPVYVTVAGHIEDGQYYAEPNIYPEYRDKLIAFAELIKSYNIPFNLQIDYEFFMGANNCETEEMMAETGGTNVIDYLAENYDFEIDPHQGGGWEEGQENYADVRFLGGMVTDHITDTAGGVVWNLQEQYERFDNGESGWQYPDFTWFPQILTLGVHSNHHNGDFSNDDLTSGIWKPQGFDNKFLIHDENASMIYVGPGMSCTDWFDNEEDYPPMDTSADYAELLANYLTANKIPHNKIYTVTMSVPQSIIFDAVEYSKLISQFEQLEPLVEEGKVVYVTYKEVVAIWGDEYNCEENIFTFDNIDVEDYD